MWAPIKAVRTILVAELWKDLLDGEAVPARIVPDPDDPSEDPALLVLVSKGKEHVAEEVFRKI